MICPLTPLAISARLTRSVLFASHRCGINTRGPDGRTTLSMGRGCVCWACGHAGLPLNADKCDKVKTTPKPLCGNCGSDAQTNFARPTKPGVTAVRIFDHLLDARLRTAALCRSLGGDVLRGLGGDSNRPLPSKHQLASHTPHQQSPPLPSSHPHTLASDLDRCCRPQSRSRCRGWSSRRSPSTAPRPRARWRRRARFRQHMRVAAAAAISSRRLRSSRTRHVVAGAARRPKSAVTPAGTERWTCP